MGVDVSVIPIRLEGSTQVVELFAYDVGGQDVFIDCCEDHLHDANYVLLCFNLFDSKTFGECQDWLNLVLKARKQTSDPPCGVLVGNKADLNQSANKVDVDRAVMNKDFAFPKKHGTVRRHSPLAQRAKKNPRACRV